MRMLYQLYFIFHAQKENDRINTITLYKSNSSDKPSLGLGEVQVVRGAFLEPQRAILSHGICQKINLRVHITFFLKIIKNHFQIFFLSYFHNLTKKFKRSQNFNIFKNIFVKFLKNKINFISRIWPKTCMQKSISKKNCLEFFQIWLFEILKLIFVGICQMKVQF